MQVRCVGGWSFKFNSKTTAVKRWQESRVAHFLLLSSHLCPCIVVVAVGIGIGIDLGGIVFINENERLDAVTASSLTDERPTTSAGRGPRRARGKAQ